MMLDNATGLDVLAHTLNLRDLGGHATTDGHEVATGLVYRSAELRPADDEARRAVAGLGLHLVYDLRTADERAQDPDDLPSGAQLVVLDVFGDDSDVAPAQLKSIVGDPRQSNAILGDGRVLTALQDAYRGLVSLPSARLAYRQLFTELADDATGPALFHCTAGKDRTGWGAAALLLYLGVADDDVTADYLASNPTTERLFQPQLDAFAAAGGDAQLLAPLFQVQESYLAAALDEVTSRYGDIAGYFSTGLALNDAVQARLRERLLT